MAKKDTKDSFSTPRGKQQRAKAQQRIIDQGIPAKRKARAKKLGEVKTKAVKKKLGEVKTPAIRKFLNRGKDAGKEADK